MGVDDDIAAQLPDPPPAAPLRRQRAIDEALRRFDAAQGAQPTIEPASASAGRARLWGRIGRPQAAALVTVAIIALFGVPAAWLAVGERSAPIGQSQVASVSDLAADSAGPAPLVNTPSATPSAGGSSPAVPAPASSPMPAQPAAATDTVLAKDEAREREERDAPRAVAAPATPIELARAEPESRPPAMPAKSAYASRADRSAGLADAAPPPAAPVVAPSPPPPPPAMVASVDTATTTSSNFLASAGRLAAKARGSQDMNAAAQRPAEMGAVASRDVVVTGQRRAARKPGGRGDWNACTINDPARSLQRCKRQVNPASAGPAGRAAAHVADGLTRAWQGDLDGAITDFDEAIATAPSYAAAYLNRGLALQRKGEFSRAAADLDKAVRYAPGAARGYYNRGQLLRQRGEADRADADEDRAVALDPGYEAVVE